MLSHRVGKKTRKRQKKLERALSVVKVIILLVNST